MRGPQAPFVCLRLPHENSLNQPEFQHQVALKNRVIVVGHEDEAGIAGFDD